MLFPDLVEHVRSSISDAYSEEAEAHISKAVAARNHIAEHGIHVVMKSDDGGESGTGDFLDFEHILAAIFLASWSRRNEEAHGEFLRALGNTYTASGLNRGAEAAGRVLSDLVTEEDFQAIRSAQVQAARRGAAVVNGLQVFDEISTVTDIYDGMARASRYFTNNYFNNRVLPGLQRAVQAIIENDDLVDPDQVFTHLRRRLDDRLLGRVPYWHTVSTSAASRAYHYGVIRAGRRLGYRGYRLVAVMDHKTSDICRTLNGREFWLADAERIYERVAAAEGDDIREVHPWIQGEEARGLTEDEVLERATYVPPFHGRCRTTMQLISV